MTLPKYLSYWEDNCLSFFLKFVLLQFKFIPAEFKYRRDSNGLKIQFWYTDEDRRKNTFHKLCFYVSMFAYMSPLNPTRKNTRRKKRYWKKYGKNWKIYASVPFNAVCQKFSGQISGIMPELWQSKPFGARKDLCAPFSLSSQWSHLIAKNASNYPKCQTLPLFKHWSHTKFVC